MPIFRQKFNNHANKYAHAIRKVLKPADCYRLQFSLDLSARITAHRSQGATIRDFLVFDTVG